MINVRSLVLCAALVMVFGVFAQAALQEGTITLLGLQEAPKCRFVGDSLIPGAMSFVIPGLGQFANGQDGKGFLHLGVAIALPTAFYFLAVVLNNSLFSYGTLALAFPILQLGWHAYSAYEAYSVNGEYCRGT